MIPNGLTWVSFLSLNTIFTMLSMGSWNSRHSWDSTVLWSNGPHTHKEEPRSWDEAQPGGLSERRATPTASASEENLAASVEYQK